jgi:alpha-1,2-glucosyltransferase
VASEPGPRGGRPVWTAGAASISLILGALAVHGLPPLSDEVHHYRQIQMFLNGRWAVVDSLTTLPTYHALLAGLAHVIGASSLDALRLLTLLASAGAIAVVREIARTVSPQDADLRTLQVLFLPILFPMLFLVYTDVLSLFSVGAAVLACLRRSFLVAGFLATAAVAVRQSNVVWLAMVWGMCALEIGGADVSWRFARRLLAATWSFGLGALGLAAFVLWNGGVALGDRGMHPSFTVHFENVYFVLVLFFLLYVPVCLERAEAAFALLRRPWVLAGVSLLLLLFLFAYEIDHPYNQPAYDGFVHNRLLHALDATPAARAVFVAAAAMSALSLATVPLRRSSFLAFYPAAVVSLLPVWLVEQRYYLVPFALFQVFRAPFGARIEWILLAFWAGSSVYLLAGIVRGWFFP